MGGKVVIKLRITAQSSPAILLFTSHSVLFYHSPITIILIGADRGGEGRGGECCFTHAAAKHARGAVAWVLRCTMLSAHLARNCNINMHVDMHDALLQKVDGLAFPFAVAFFFTKR